MTQQTSKHPEPRHHEMTAPRSLSDLFWGLSIMAVQGFGAAAAVSYRELVDRRGWLSPQVFAEDWAVAQVMPGPNTINLCLMVGDRYFGWRGALVALAGVLTFPIMIVVTIAILYAKYSDNLVVSGSLYGMGAVAAGLIMGTGLKLFSAINKDIMGLTITVLIALGTFIAIGIFRLPLIWFLIIGGVAATAWAFLQIKRFEAFEAAKK
jgi:chromate transporter